MGTQKYDDMVSNQAPKQFHDDSQTLGKYPIRVRVMGQGQGQGSTANGATAQTQNNN